jgi:hypothetical protein
MQNNFMTQFYDPIFDDANDANDADPVDTETTLPTSDDMKGPHSFFLYIAYPDTSTDFVKMGSCQDAVKRTGSLPNMAELSDRDKYKNLLFRYKEVQRQVASGPEGFMNFDIYQPSDSVHAWLNATHSIRKIPNKKQIGKSYQ